ncbi:acetylcholinesterase [Colletotrichum higginsianum]|uniref:Carboxylic ester hydrolase n=2 Tax=Colletotrichum higginsianum TaxID=80884 RepID=H1VB58_COLHI|nr:Carboxylesterase patB [Colletotrichum higginsianum]CCF37461.1 acetylcholinesterase [Colletotrichum higginsianum]
MRNVLLLGVVLSILSGGLAASLPVVDLGYELYQATGFNEAEGYYNFSNIRYASPPVGELRFRAPVPPATNRSAVRNGLDFRICPQAQPLWMATSVEWLFPYLTKGVLPNVTGPAAVPTADGSSPALARDDRENEDCLFLDVLVPKRVFAKSGQKAPVLVEIHGGGYALGSKSESEPRGLLRRSTDFTEDGIVYVRMNYRLGAFGFLSGPTFSKDGTANAGLLDQRMALEWVQENIHLFGGDKDRVTVFGGSAGAGSIIHQVSAFGGEQHKRLFQRAIPQSPAWLPMPSALGQERSFNEFLEAANVSSISEARSLTSAQLIQANSLRVSLATPGTFGFGPTIDGQLVRDDPRALLDSGRFDKSIDVLFGHNPNEGLGFHSPVANSAEYLVGLRALLPHADDSVIRYLSDTLYPPRFNSSLYPDQMRRMGLTVTEAAFTCAASALGRAFAKADANAYGYVLETSFGLHGTDAPFIYFYPETSTVNETMASTLQDYMLSFVVDGVPDSDSGGLGRMMPYGQDGRVVRITADGILQGIDPAANARCKWWQLGLYR